MFRIGERVTATAEIDKEFGDRDGYQLQQGQVGIIESISRMEKDYPIWVTWPGAKIEVDGSYGNSYHQAS